MGNAWFALGFASVVVYAFALGSLGRREATPRSHSGSSPRMHATALWLAACVGVLAVATFSGESDWVPLAIVVSAAGFGVVGLLTYAFGVTSIDRPAVLEPGAVWIAWIFVQFIACLIAGWAVGLIVAFASGEAVIA